MLLDISKKSFSSKKTNEFKLIFWQSYQKEQAYGPTLSEVGRLNMSTPIVTQKTYLSQSKQRTMTLKDRSRTHRSTRSAIDMSGPTLLPKGVSSDGMPTRIREEQPRESIGGALERRRDLKNGVESDTAQGGSEESTGSPSVSGNGAAKENPGEKDGEKEKTAENSSENVPNGGTDDCGRPLNLPRGKTVGAAVRRAGALSQSASQEFSPRRLVRQRKHLTATVNIKDISAFLVFKFIESDPLVLAYELAKIEVGSLPLRGPRLKAFF